MLISALQENLSDSFDDLFYTDDYFHGVVIFFCTNIFKMHVTAEVIYYFRH